MANPDQVRLLEGRLAACARLVQEALDHEARTHDLSRSLAESLDAGSGEPSAAMGYLDALCTYIQNVPAMLRDRLNRAVESGTSPGNRDTLLEYVNAALESFEKPSPVPDALGLVGVLDNAYLVYQLLPPPADLREAHRMASELLGEALVRELDDRAAGITQRLGELGTEAEVDAAAAGSRGPCEQCMHVRHGTAIARTAFDLVLDALKPSIADTYDEKRRAEEDAAGQAYYERQSLGRQSLEPRGDGSYTRRPTDPRLMYCGLEEFAGRALSCEARNGHQQCEQFDPTTEARPARVCRTCRHNYRLPSSVLHTLEAIAGRTREGLGILEEIRRTLQTQARSEYTECVAGQGILSFRPGTIAICHERSTSTAEAEPRFVVGPLLNVGSQCEPWIGGDNEEVGRVVAELAQLEADATRALAAYSNPPVTDGNDPGSSADRFKASAANAEADVLQYGLTALAVEPNFVESVCARFMSEVWRVTARTERASRAASAAFLQTNVPFLLERHQTYRHPDEPALTIGLGFMAGTIDVQGERYPLANCPLNTWVQLPGRHVAVKVSAAGAGFAGSMSLSAVWLQPGAAMPRNDPSAGRDRSRVPPDRDATLAARSAEEEPPQSPSSGRIALKIGDRYVAHPRYNDIQCGVDLDDDGSVYFEYKHPDGLYRQFKLSGVSADLRGSWQQMHGPDGSDMPFKLFIPVRVPESATEGETVCYVHWT